MSESQIPFVALVKERVCAKNVDAVTLNEATVVPCSVNLTTPQVGDWLLISWWLSLSRAVAGEILASLSHINGWTIGNGLTIGSTKIVNQRIEGYASFSGLTKVQVTAITDAYPLVLGMKGYSFGGGSATIGAGEAQMVVEVLR